MDTSLVAGVDIGGSHITVALVDICKGEILKHTWKRVAINAQGSAPAIISAWSKAIRDSFGLQGLEAGTLGMAMPGPFDYEKGIALMKGQNKFDALYGLNVKRLLSDSLDIAPQRIFMDNDAACFMKGELFGGVAKGCNRVLGFTLGTGLGSARSVDGKAEDADLWCAPFGDGIAEDYLSTRWFVKRYRELTGRAVSDVKEIAELCADGSDAEGIFREFGRNFGAFLLPYIQKDRTELVVLGGNIAKAYPLFASGLGEALGERTRTLQIRQTDLGEDAALMGAASCCVSQAAVPM